MPSVYFMDEFQPFHISKNDIQNETYGYSLRFKLPDGNPVKINHWDQEALLRAAKELYEGNAISNKGRV